LKVVQLSAAQQLLRFGIFELSLATGELRKSGTLIKLPPQSFKLLALLATFRRKNGSSDRSNY
jgi:hypothetical protein